MQVSLIALATAVMLTMTMCTYDGRPMPVANDAAAEEAPSSTSDGQAMAWRLTRDSRIRLAGSATIGSWDCVGQQAQAELAPGASAAALLAVIERVEADASLAGDDLELELARTPAASLAVRIDALGCGNAAMERDMHDALKAEDHPQILYTLTQVHGVSVQREGDEAAPVFVLDTAGELSLAGEARAVKMAVHVRRAGEHRLAVLGSKELNMRDFGVEPPTALLGLIRANPNVEVVFDLVVEPAVDEEQERDEAQ